MTRKWIHNTIVWSWRIIIIVISTTCVVVRAFSPTRPLQGAPVTVTTRASRRTRRIRFDDDDWDYQNNDSLDDNYENDDWVVDDYYGYDYDYDSRYKYNKHKRVHTLLSYLPGVAAANAEDLSVSSLFPPLTIELLVNVTENHIRHGGGYDYAGAGALNHPLHVNQVIQLEYQSIHVPVQLILLNERESRIMTLAQPMAEIISLAVLLRLPSEMALQLLPSVVAGSESSSSSSSSSSTSSPMNMNMDHDDSDCDSSSVVKTIRAVLAQQGWNAVSFPHGLALEPKKQTQKRRTIHIRHRHRNRHHHRVELAAVALKEAQTTVAPARRRIRREELWASLQEKIAQEELEEETNKKKKEDALPNDNMDSTTRSNYPSSSKSPSSSTITSTSIDDLFFFFPDSIPTLPLSWKRLKRMIDTPTATLKSQGPAGILAYSFLNLVLYSAGMLWKWQRVTPNLNPLLRDLANPNRNLTHRHVITFIVLRKFGRVLGSLYLYSQLCTLPKLLAAVALLPLAKKALKATQQWQPPKLQRWWRRWSHRSNDNSETHSSMFLVIVMFTVWSLLTAFLILHEHQQLRRFVSMERMLLLGGESQPVVSGN